MSNVNWSTNLGLLTGVVCSGGRVRGKGSGRWIDHCDGLRWEGPLLRVQPSHRYDLSPAAADLRTFEFWHWLCTPALSFPSIYIHVILHDAACPRSKFVLFLIVRSDVYFLRTALFGGQSPAVDVMRSLLLLLRLGALLFQLLPFELCSSVLEPHFYLNNNNTKTNTVSLLDIKKTRAT